MRTRAVHQDLQRARTPIAAALVADVAASYGGLVCVNAPWPVHGVVKNNAVAMLRRAVTRSVVHHRLRSVSAIFLSVLLSGTGTKGSTTQPRRGVMIWE